VSATDELLGGYQHVISELTLVMGSKGVFDVHVNGDLVFSKHETGRYPNDGELLAQIGNIVGPDVDLYGT
jgi:selenoprotein W-related protein